MTLHQLLTEESKKQGVSDEHIAKAHIFAKAAVEAVGGEDEDVSQTELSPEDEREYRAYIKAGLQS